MTLHNHLIIGQIWRLIPWHQLQYLVVNLLVSIDQMDGRKRKSFTRLIVKD